MTKDRIIFCKFEDGEVIAFIPDAPANNGFILSYMHVGQHSEACLDFAETLQPATQEEYQDLLDELISIGYDVEVSNE